MSFTFPAVSIICTPAESFLIPEKEESPKSKEMYINNCIPVHKYTHRYISSTISTPLCGPRRLYAGLAAYVQPLLPPCGRCRPSRGPRCLCAALAASVRPLPPLVWPSAPLRGPRRLLAGLADFVQPSLPPCSCCREPPPGLFPLNPVQPAQPPRRGRPPASPSGGVGGRGRPPE